MFHCNGWGHAWTMTAVAGTVVCVRAFDPKLAFNMIEQHSITHFGGARIVPKARRNAKPGEKKKVQRFVERLRRLAGDFERLSS